MTLFTNSPAAFYDFLSLLHSCLVLDVLCKLENLCQQGCILHLHRGMNYHCLRKHLLRLFLSRWSRNYLWRLPVPSPTVVNARLINLRNAHTRRGSYSYNVQDARIGTSFFKRTHHSSTKTTRIILPLGTWLQTILVGSKRARRTASCALLRTCWKQKGRRYEKVGWILMERWNIFLSEDSEEGELYKKHQISVVILSIMDIVLGWQT